VIDKGSPISYGTLNNGMGSAERTLSFINNGNVQGEVFVRGNLWKDLSTQNVVMQVDNTHYSRIQGTAYRDKVSLQNFDVSTNIFADPGVLNSLFWQLKPTLINPAYIGNAIQHVTLSSIC